MGKVTIIKKSRKECKCGKCGNIIPVGSKYYRGEMRFIPDIVRCDSCKLESWEVTTSDYILQVGRIANKWSEDYECSASGAENIASDLEELKDELQDRLDNMPYQLQEADTGQLLQDRIDNLESVIDELNAIDEDSLKDDVVSEYEPEDGDDDDEVEWDDDNEEMTSALEEKISDAIEEALSNLEY